MGDVDIKVIGADNQMIDTEIPVRQLMGTACSEAFNTTVFAWVELVNH